MTSTFQLIIDEKSHHIRSAGYYSGQDGSRGMAFGKKPTWISGPDQNGILVVHVVGSLLYSQEDGSSAYAPSRFLVLRVDEEERDVKSFKVANAQPRVDMIYVCTLLVEIMGIPKKPSIRRAL